VYRLLGEYRYISIYWFSPNSNARYKTITKKSFGGEENIDRSSGCISIRQHIMYKYKYLVNMWSTTSSQYRNYFKEYRNKLDHSVHMLRLSMRTGQICHTLIWNKIFSPSPVNIYKFIVRCIYSLTRYFLSLLSRFILQSFYLRTVLQFNVYSYWHTRCIDHCT
jgi:hypothetical protein